MRSDEQIDDRAPRSLATPLLRFLGASLIQDRGDGLALSFPLEGNALNAVGVLHGGAIATVLDVAAYLAVLPHLRRDEEAITITFAASYLAGAAPGATLRAIGILVHRTRRLGFLRAELLDDDSVLAVANVRS